MSERERMTGASTPSEMDEAMQEERLRALFAAADPPVRASAALRRRVGEGTALTPAPRTRRAVFGGTPARVALGLAGASALALVYAVVAPRWVAAQVLQRVEAAEKKVGSAHAIAWKFEPGGGRTKQGETWYQDGRWRLLDAATGRVQVFADGKLWTYEPKLNKVTVRRTDGPFGFNPSGFSLTAMKHDYAHWGWRDEFRLLGDDTVNGRRAHQILVHRADSPERTILKVDAESDLPIASESQLQQGDRWVTLGVAEQRYDEALEAALFEPRFPESATVLDLDHGREEWKARLSRGIARQRVGGREIVIRDLQVNAEGDVFMLYTAGKHLDDSSHPHRMYSRDWDVEIKDESGAVYVGRTQMMTDSQVPPKYRTGWLFNGEQWEGDWWVSLRPQSPWKPRRILVTFRVPTANGHGKARGNEPPPPSATFAIGLRGPECQVVPDYMAFLFAGVQEDEVLSSRARGRAWYYRYEQRDLPKALAYYEEVNRLRDERSREIGEHIYDSQTWLDIGGVYRDMGRRDEARTAFKQALKEAIYPDSQREEAKNALERLDAEEAWSPGHPAPSFAATDLLGHKQTPEQYRGQVLLIHFWGAWADDNGALHADLPLVNRIYQQYQGRGLAVLGIAIHFERDKVDKIIREEHLAWPQVYDGLDWRSPLYRSFGAPKVPGSLLIDRQGVVRGVGLRGPALEKAVAALLAAP